ncbi:Uncharacterized conserved protein, DUF305 family [Arthrobacter subterraneus]|uniref:Uncharacterized conserved protein, DUF305 family n=1 Tax=Arthrobacter subterraneus TaxID=335973 RepID=A0A1G8NPT2_9MICC|nr:DUF305 domain-containing protein [Arthrobacter subterraneus]SDI82279.1 Uncharacterized conserved protein, DUF305 family [Arthrobacter subterraneus]
MKLKPAHITIAVLAAILLLAVGVIGGRLLAGSPEPGDASADAGFARDMQRHHAQAVEMSMLVLDRTDTEPVRALAYDIALTQQQQIGQMFAWLQDWGLPQTGSGTPMQWMPEHQMSPAGTGEDQMSMPGMASAEDLDRLRDSQGDEAERLYLELMIDHHRGGVQMAQAALETATTDQVRDLAGKLITSQSSEIDAMNALLQSP